MIYFSRELSHPYSFKVNFDNSILNKGEFDGTSFVMRTISGILMVTREVFFFFKTTALMAELCVAYKGLKFMVMHLKAIHVILEAYSMH